jgi:hypothetical protein
MSSRNEADTAALGNFLLRGVYSAQYIQNHCGETYAFTSRNLLWSVLAMAHNLSPSSAAKVAEWVRFNEDWPVTGTGADSRVARTVLARLDARAASKVL